MFTCIKNIIKRLFYGKQQYDIEMQTERAAADLKYNVDTKVRSIELAGGSITCISGVSGSGKTFKALERRMERPDTIILDGDSLRRYVTYGLQYTTKDRKINNKIAADIAVLLCKQGKNVIISTVMSYVAYKYIKDKYPEINIGMITLDPKHRYK